MTEDNRKFTDILKVKGDLKMSTADFYELCPQCKKYLAWGTYYCNSGELDLSCGVCGYSYEERIEYGKEALNDEIESGYLPNSDGAGDRDHQPRKGIIEKNKGFGASSIEYRQGGSIMSCYPVPITQVLIEKFLQKISSPEVDPAKCYLTRWNDETGEVEFVFGREELLSWECVPENRRKDVFGEFRQEEPLPAEFLTDDLSDNVDEEA